MPTKFHVPAYRHFKPRNLAVVRIRGKDIYLGKFESPASWEKYHRLIAELHAAQRNGRLSAPPVPEIGEPYFGINCLVEQYLEFARLYYQRDGRPTRECVDIEYALEPLCELFGLSNAYRFGPKSLKLVQQHMISKDWCRRLINQRINRIRRMFKWAVAEELVSPTVLHGLQALPGLRYGRSAARETEPVKPVADEHIDATLPFLTQVVAAMVRVQRLTGMRPCEVVLMRPADIDRGGAVWVYEPFDHKNRWRGHQRLIPLGPMAQEILRPFLDRPAGAFLFSPKESEQQRGVERRKNRKSPMTPSQAARRPKARAKRPKRDHYDTASYRRAIDYAVKAANNNK
jgi:integrase